MRRRFNRNRLLSNARIIAALVLILAAVAMAFMAASPRAVAQPTAPPTNQQLSPEEKQKQKDWRDSMLRKPVPKNGCFNAAYPETEWQEVPCVAAPNIPSIPRHGSRPAVVGNGNDVAAQAPSGHITKAVSVPNQPITNMANWRFTGTATSTGDSITMSTGTNVYTAIGDNAVAASTAWTIAEFNIFGYGRDNSGGGGTASFNAGAS